MSARLSLDRHLQFSDYRSVAELKKLQTIIGWTEQRLGQRPARGFRILEIGCGTGSLSLPLASLGFDVLGIDVDLASIREAERRNPFKNARFAVLDILDAQTTQVLSSVDLVICSEVLQYLPEPATALRLMRRLSPPPGALILTTTNGRALYELAGRVSPPLRAMLRYRVGAAEHVPDTRSVVSLNRTSRRIQLFTAGGLRRLLAQAGWSIRLWRNSDWLAIGPLALRSVVAALDCKVADHLPQWMANGWYMACD